MGTIPLMTQMYCSVLYQRPEMHLFWSVQIFKLTQYVKFSWLYKMSSTLKNNIISFEYEIVNLKRLYDVHYMYGV
jgi:hypothetical protein